MAESESFAATETKFLNIWKADDFSGALIKKEKPPGGEYILRRKWNSYHNAGLKGRRNSLAPEHWIQTLTALEGIG